jgi:hypothetical protein
LALRATYSSIRLRCSSSSTSQLLCRISQKALIYIVVLWLSVPHILLIFSYIISQALCSPLLCPFSNLSFKVSLCTKKRREYTYTYIHLCVLARAQKKEYLSLSQSMWKFNSHSMSGDLEFYHGLILVDFLRNQKYLGI